MPTLMEAMRKKSRIKWLEESQHNPLACSADIVISFEELWAYIPPGNTISMYSKAAEDG